MKFVHVNIEDEKSYIIPVNLDEVVSVQRFINRFKSDAEYIINFVIKGSNNDIKWIFASKDIRNNYFEKILELLDSIELSECIQL